MNICFKSKNQSTILTFCNIGIKMRLYVFDILYLQFILLQSYLNNKSMNRMLIILKIYNMYIINDFYFLIFHYENSYDYQYYDSHFLVSYCVKNPKKLSLENYY